jgi:hypothetical protein
MFEFLLFILLVAVVICLGFLYLKYRQSKIEAAKPLPPIGGNSVNGTSVFPSFLQWLKGLLKNG